MPKEKPIKICPKCGSINVHPDLSKDMIVWGGSTSMKCDNCGYSAILFPETLKSKIKDLKVKKIKKTEKAPKKLPSSKIITRKGSNLWGWFYLIIGMAIVIAGFRSASVEGLHEERYFFSLLLAAFPLIMGLLLVKDYKIIVRTATITLLGWFFLLLDGFSPLALKYMIIWLVIVMALITFLHKKKRHK